MHDEPRAERVDGSVGRPEWTAPRLKRLDARDTIQISVGMFADGGSPSEGAS